MAMTKAKTCVQCGHTFDPTDPRRGLSDPDWLPVASVYCSQKCSDRFHSQLAHCCSTHLKENAQREAAKAARRRN
ncbi:ferric uptake regulation protein [Mycobacterium asiaticum]|uniref:ferric uptake regulation protein n=1 Tax=Mycobacterium asiaticum TaxID=1790 RepID=UPI000AE364B8|nr:ferric uptake regulation protein [Mycobacterium asiaticum]